MPDPVLQKEVLAVLLRDTKPALWAELIRLQRGAYNEAYAAVANDARVLPNQKPAKLLDERFYLCERALHDAAVTTGATSSGQMVAINRWVYTIVRAGPVLMIQSYVSKPGDFSRPAKFREQHASLNDFSSRPQLPLGDVATELFEIAAIAGILIHGPIDNAFSQGAQSIGFLRFCVPSSDYRRWEVDLPVTDIIAAFGAENASPEQRDIATPRRRDQDKRGNEGKA